MRKVPSRLHALSAAAALALAALIPRAAGAIGHVDSLLEIRNQGVVRQHWDLSCGAAALATLMTYQLGAPVTEREAALGMLQTTSPLLVRSRLGFSLLDLKRFAASRGFAAAGYAGLSVDELVAMAPVIAPIRVNGFGHFVVVRGERDGWLLIADPAFGNRTMSREAFAGVWPGSVGFVVFPPDRPRPPNRMAAPADLFLAPGGASLRATDASLRGWSRVR